MVIWGYKKGKGRYYKRTTGTVRFPDSGDIRDTPTSKTLSLEKTQKNFYGLDKGKIKKTRSKPYIIHKVRPRGKKPYIRGRYTRLLR